MKLDGLYGVQRALSHHHVIMRDAKPLIARGLWRVTEITLRRTPLGNLQRCAEPSKLQLPSLLAQYTATMAKATKMQSTKWPLR